MSHAHVPVSGKFVCNHRSTPIPCLWAMLAFVLYLGGTAGAAPSSPVQFSGLYQTFSQPGRVGSSAFAQMTPNGPVAGTVVHLPVPLSDVAFDPNGSGYYGAIYQSVYHMNPGAPATAMMISGPGITDTSWPIGITFDTSRNRVVLSTLAGEGFLYAYSPAQQQWSFISSLNNVDLQSIAYRASNDTLYGLPNSPGGGMVSSIYKYDANGHFLGTVALQHALPGSILFSADTNYQLLVTSDDQLAVLTPPLPDPATPGSGPHPRLYLIDPATGAISYDAVFPVPEPAAIGWAMLASVMGLRRRDRAPRTAGMLIMPSRGARFPRKPRPTSA